MAAFDDAPETKPVPPPMIGSYRLVEPLGSGGMSSVFRAIHADTGHEVAVKVLPRYLAKNPTLLQRFTREAKSAESLEDPNIVAIYDRGSESGRHYLVLEYVPGGDLHDRVRSDGPLPLLEAVDAVRQVARGLKHAAGRGLIHRDIKPANILRRPDGVVKITDLGLALQIEDEDEKVTRDGTTVGTVDYMAPEQARDSRAASIKSDIYSLGCTLYFLLTGTPPFAGGDVAEKLKAHATEPAPDPRIVRPEVTSILARLVKKMMAKRPEKRFADYDALLVALDAVAASLGKPPALPAKPKPAAPLMALIDDEDDDEALPVMALFDDENDTPKKGSSAGAPPLMALIDDEDDDESFELGPGIAGPGGTTISTPTMTSRGGTGLRRGEDDSLGGVDFSGLEGIEEESPALPPKKRSPASSGGIKSPGGSRLVIPAGPGPSPEVVYDLAPPIAPPVHMYEVAPPPEPGVPLTTWLARFVLAGVVILLIGFGWTRVSPYIFEEKPEEIIDPALDGSGSGGSKGQAEGKVATRWTEPQDSIPATPIEPPIPNGALARLNMEGAADEALPREEGPFVTVRRVDPLRDRDNVGELPRAFENLGGTVTLADNGPFFEEMLRISGEIRVVRAAPGYRPVVVLGRPDTEVAKKRPSAVVLDHQTLVVVGVDFVVDAAALTARQESLFLLRNGSSLTLRDCTVTVAGPVRHAYAVVQVGDRGAANGGAASIVRIERSRLRGDASALRLASSAKATIARSFASSAKGAIVEFAGDPRADRSVSFFRSALASQGPIFDLIGSAGSSESRPPTIRSFESTFAAVAGGPKTTPFVTLSDVPPGPPRPPSTLVNWKGESDVFAGWEAWSSASPRGLLAGLGGASSETERSARESPDVWPSEIADAWATSLLTEAASKVVASPLLKIATPASSLKARTLGQFPPVAMSPKVPVGEVVTLKFNAEDEGYNGDLGKFLMANVKGSTRRVKVQVSGSGRHGMTPVAMPPGVSLEVEVAPVPAGSPPLIWTTPDDATGEALLSVRDADLTISGAKFTATPKTPLPTLLAVNHGSFSLSKSTLIGPFGEESSGGNLVSFRTDGTKPAPGGGRASFNMNDCVLLTGGDAIILELGKGSVVISNCAIASGTTAFVLIPQKVRRDAFDADLTLVRSTIAAEENLFRLNAWTGLAPGPDRPWVVRSSGCMFSDAFVRPAQSQTRGVLLRTQVEGLDRNVIAWESSGDAYDLTLFTAGGEAKPLPVSRADVRRSWGDLWGPSHIESPGGFTANGGVPPARFLIDQLKPLELAPGDLAIDPNYPPSRKSLNIGADLSRMGIVPTVPKFRPRS